MGLIKFSARILAGASNEPEHVLNTADNNEPKNISTFMLDPAYFNHTLLVGSWTYDRCSYCSRIFEIAK